MPGRCSVYTDNVQWMLDNASVDAVESGKAWYPIVRRWCKVKAAEYGVRPVVVAALISALSPRNRWERNLSDAEQVLINYAEGFHHPFNITSGTFRKNVEKAWRIVVNDNPDEVLTSPKTRAFIDNIINPGSQVVTVDVWALRVCEGDMFIGARSIGEKKYLEYSDAYMEVAHEMEVLPCTVQAITWVEARNRTMVAKKAAIQQMRLL